PPAELADRAERDRPLAEVLRPRGRFELVVPARPQLGELALGAVLRERVRLRGGLGERHAGTRAASRIAAAERSTSAVVVRQLETETRIACSPNQSVPLIQQVPSCCTRAIVSRVVSPSPKRTSTWFSTTSFSSVAPPASSSSANNCACSQQRSTSAVMPVRPSERIAA